MMNCHMSNRSARFPTKSWNREGVRFALLERRMGLAAGFGSDGSFAGGGVNEFGSDGIVCGCGVLVCAGVVRDTSEAIGWVNSG